MFSSETTCLIPAVYMSLLGCVAVPLPPSLSTLGTYKHHSLNNQPGALLHITLWLAEIDQPSAAIEFCPDGLDLVFACDTDTTPFSFFCNLYLSD